MKRAMLLFIAFLLKAQLPQNAGLGYNPAEDGFVLSVAEIETRSIRADRLADAVLAEKAGFKLEEYRKPKAA